MKNHTVQHYLNIYRLREKMQAGGITNPAEYAKKFTRDFVEKLERMPLDQEIILNENGFYDTEGNLIVTLPG